MAIPSMNDVMLPTLKLLAEGATNARECLPGLQKWFCLSKEEMDELVPSGTRGRVFDRSDWAIFHMMKAGLIDRPKRGYYQPSESGRQLLDGQITELSLKELSEFPAYQQWKEREKPGITAGSTPQEDIKLPQSSSGLTPEEAIETAFAELSADLVEDLLTATLGLSPTRFEKLILDLLRAMKYGGGDDAMYRETARSGDGGIDGIINEDALGLDAVYIQAKRYAPENKVSRPSLQAFVGSLTGEGATKGVFVTTSDFTKEAKEYVDRVQQRIVLINGDRLARLMIQHDVGVRPRKVYILRSVDEDYFSDV